MLSYPATITLSSRTLNHLANRIRGHRQQRGSRWRRLNPGRQALLALAHLRNGDTYTRLAAGFQIGIATAWRYVQEAIALLSTAADDLETAMQRIRRLAYAIVDGTLIPIDRVADQRPYYSGKHKRHGVNVQVLADPAGRLVWASAALPGSTHDLTAARIHGIIDALASADVMTFADKGYQGARGSVRTPFKRRRFRPKLSRRQKTVNRAHATIRARGERAIATLKTWKILIKLRCCPRRATAI
ncbi:transposase family protein, partial [Actinoplanes auranticolor]